MTALRPTLFPRFDALVALPKASTTAHVTTAICRREFDYAARPDSSPTSRSSLLRAYSRFISSLTGESEVSFELVVRSDLQSTPQHELVVATARDEEPHANGEAHPEKWAEFHFELHLLTEPHERLEFGLEILIDPDNFVSRDVQHSLNCPFVVQYHATQLSLVLLYHRHILPDDFADVLFNALVRQCARQDYSWSNDNEPIALSESQRSVLNHPPLSNPPALQRNSTVARSTYLLHEGFQNAAKRHPSRDALHYKHGIDSGFRDEILTYAELDALSTALAVKIRKHVATSGARVIPVYMPASPAFYVSWLAVLKAGSAFCPLPVDAPRGQLQLILKDVGASLVLRSDASFNAVDGMAATVDVDDFIHHLRTNTEPRSGEANLPPVDRADLAYIMYTSGSTGVPKGVQIHHLAAACSIASHSQYLPSSFGESGFRWFQFAAPTFDPSVMEIFTTLWNGGTICSAHRETLLTNPEQTVDSLSANIMMATPSMANLLRPEKVPRLKFLWCMGENLTSRVIQNFTSNSSLQEPEPRRYLLNAYGPTEGAINCTIAADFSSHDRGSIIGKPISTCSILILDPKRREPIPLPLGFAGELTIGGPQVSRGYLNRPDQTAQAFVSSSQYGLLYRTGDRARIVKNQQGELVVEFMGRLSSLQVKVSGRRVELSQVESALSATSRISEVAVVVHGSTGVGSEGIVACVVPGAECENDNLLQECRRLAEATLLPFMRPLHYIVLDSIPRSRSGKTDRKALAATVESRIRSVDTSSRETTKNDYNIDSQVLERINYSVAAVCGTNLQHLSPDSNLLSLGLDSLRAVRFLQVARQQGILGLTVADVLRCGTIGRLARLCEQKDPAVSSPQQTSDYLAQFEQFAKRQKETCVAQIDVREEDIEMILPTTATQSGMIASYMKSMAAKLNAGLRVKYVDHAVFHQAEGLDDTKLEEAWHQTLLRPRMLRTAFFTSDDDLAPFGQCVIHPSSDAAALVLRRYSCPDETSWPSLLAHVREEAEKSISLTRPPLKLSVVKSEKRTAYVLSMFHGLYDGGSLELLRRDVEEAYRGNTLPQTTDIETTVARHFSLATKATADYWTDLFRHVETAPFPNVLPYKPETIGHQPMATDIISKISIGELLTASKHMSISPLSILQGAWVTILSAYSGSTTDLTFGTVAADRFEEALISCIAPTFVVVPTKFSLAEKPRTSVNEVLSRFTSLNSEAVTHHHIPLGALKNAHGSLPYDTLLILQAFNGSSEQSELWTNVEFPPPMHDFAVMIEIWPTTDGPLRLRASYTSNYMDQKSAEMMLRQLDDIICFLCDHPDAEFLDARSAVSPNLQSQIPATMVENEPSWTLHGAFEKNAAEHPDAQALLFKKDLSGHEDDVVWSYRELDSLSEAFASRILERYGSITNEAIMICMEKCPELYVAVLGILKVGAGWCPIDPYSPPTRQKSLMEMTGSRFLVSTASSTAIDPVAVPKNVCEIDIDLCLLAQSVQEGKQVLPIREKNSSHLAYLIFTSGTTGLPKGVPITHGSAKIAMDSLALTIPSNVAEGQVRCMQFSQYTFDVFVQDLFYTWTIGGLLISSTRQIMLQSFADLANKAKATHAHLTPAFSATLPRSRLETLEVVTQIGEKLTEAVANDWGHLLRSYNTYGPAEATVVSTLRQFTGKSDQQPSSNIGVPLPSVGTYVVQDGNLVMCGGLGELALAGPQLSSGYWKLPEVNKEKFVWNAQLQQRLYLTGDFVRHLADGTINFIGRKDDLVKLGGIRVELGEISFALKGADPRINALEVLLCDRKTAKGKAVVAFLACPSLSHDDDGEVKPLLTSPAGEVARAADEYGRSVLPSHMVPSQFVVVPRIPRTASAKIDRAVLTAAYHSCVQGSHEIAAKAMPSGTDDTFSTWRQTNKKVLEAVSQTLSLSPDSLRPNASLSSVGIDSIGAIRLLPKLQSFGVVVSILDVLKCRTLSDLCSLLHQAPAEAALEISTDRLNDDFDALYRDAVADHLTHHDFSLTPTTIMQESILSESLKEPRAYWSTFFFRLNESIDLRRLKSAWNSVAAHTEALRAAFIPSAVLGEQVKVKVNHGLTYVQVVYEYRHVDWHESTISVSVDDAGRKRLSELAKKHHQSVYGTPPWAVDIFKKDNEKIMMLTIHHSIFDMASLHMLESDLRSAYFRRPRSAHRNQLSLLAATISSLNSDQEESILYWKSLLEDFEADYGVGHELLQGYRSSEEQHRVQHIRSRMTISDLRDTARRLQIPSFVSILRTAWALVLTDLLEIEHLLSAEVRSDRITDRALDNVVGPLLSVIPTIFRRRDTIFETLRDESETSQSAWKHRNIRPVTLRGLLKQNEAQLLYPAFFTFHPTPSESTDGFSPLWEREADMVYLRVEHPFALNVHQESQNDLSLELGVDAKIMSEREQTVLLEQVEELISAISQNPWAKISSLSGSLSTRLISRTTPKSTASFPSTFHPAHWVEHWAETHPNWRAAEVATEIETNKCDTRSWSFTELNSEANRVAHWIRNQVSDATVGMCLGRTLMSYAVVLAIMKSGNTYLPIDEGLPAARKALLLEDSNARLVFTTKELIDPVDLPDQCVLVDVESEEFPKTLNATRSANIQQQYRPRDNAYILYTSGSTGKPKGVLVSYENLSSFVEAQSEFICNNVQATKTLGGRGKYLGLASRAFDVHLGEMFLAWKHGLAAVTANRSVLLDDLALALSSLHITHASFVPSLLDQTGLVPEDTPDLVYLGVGGEKMSPNTKKKWASHERVGLINAYGPTEATIGLCSARLYHDSDMRNIGTPMGDCVGHILVPGTEHYTLRGVPGELCFTGSLIANGYLNRPEAKGFVDDFHGKRMYRTGDIAKLTSEDNILFLGRKDDQVKIRGQRVELGEVAEGVRLGADKPVDTVALVLKHPDLSRSQLVAFLSQVTTKRRKGNDPPAVVRKDLFTCNTTIRQKCQKSLPIHMVPDLIIPLNYIPLTPTSAKSDIKLLTSVFNSLPIDELLTSDEAAGDGEAENRDSEPLNDAEKQVWGVISSVLKAPKSDPSPGTTMFKAGVDSLSAISVFAKLRAAGYQYSIADLMRNPTIREIASFPPAAAARDLDINAVRKKLEQLSLDYIDGPYRVVATEAIEAVRPCIPLQEILLAQSLHQLLDATNITYINHITFRVSADVDMDLMRHAWRTVVDNNEILRTCFSTAEEPFLQIVLAKQSFSLPWERVSIPSIDDVSSLQRQNAIDILKTFSTSPPLRLVHSTDDMKRNVILLSIHHALYDANSLEMLFEDVQRIYADQPVTSRPSLTPLIEYIAAQDQEQSKSYWLDKLHKWNNAPILSQDPFSRTSLQTMERKFSCKASVLKSRASHIGITSATLLQAAFAIAMCQSLQTNDFIFGNVLSGRSIPVEGADQTMAPCIATIPQRISLNDQQILVHDVLKALQKSNSASLDFQHVSPRNIQRWVKADRALYDCLFSYMRRDKKAEPPSSILTNFKNDIMVDYSLAVEFEVDFQNETVTANAGLSQAVRSSFTLDALLEKIETLTNMMLDSDNMAVVSLGIPQASRQISSRTEAPDESELSSLEQNIRTIISEFASVSKRNIHRNTAFIHLGIDSISAIRFAKTLRESGYKISSVDVIRHNRLGALCKHINSGKSAAVRDTVYQGTKDYANLKSILRSKISLQNEDDIQCYECTPLQAGMLSQSSATDGALYMHYHAFCCNDDIDLHRLREAWNTLCRDLDVLRTTFHFTPDHKKPWLAAVHKNISPSWREVQTADARSYWYDLSKGPNFVDRVEQCEPLAGIEIVKTPGELVMILALHHSLYDGISLGMMYRNLAMHYHHIEVPKSLPFYEAARVISHNSGQAVDFWVNQVRGYQGAAILAEDSDSAFELSEQLVASDMVLLQKICRENDMNIRDICVVAFGKALATLYGRRDVVFGSVIAARTNEFDDEAEIVGPMFNTVPVRVTFKDQAESNKSAAHRAGELNASSIEHQHASLSDIQKVWKSDATNPLAALLDSLFVYSKVQKPELYGLESLGKPMEADKSPVPSEYRINFEVEHSDKSLTARILSSLPKIETTEFLDKFCSAVNDMVNRPNNFATTSPAGLRNLPLQVSSNKRTPISFNKASVDRFADVIRKAMEDVGNISPGKITLDSNIHSFGIDSIAAIQIASRCRRDGIKIGVADIIKGTMLGKICEIVAAKNTKDDAIKPQITSRDIGPTDQDREKVLSVLSFPAESVEEILPCLPGQEYHLLSWLRSGRTFFEPVWTFKAKERLDVDRMSAAWEQLQKQNPILRTTFAAVEKRKAWQVVLKNDALGITPLRVMRCKADMVEAARERNLAESSISSDLFSPPVRLRLIQAVDGDAMVVCIHHTLYDAWTMPRLIAELDQIYNYSGADQKPSFSKLVYHTLTHIDPYSEREFWMNSLRGCQQTLLGSIRGAPSSLRQQSFSMIESESLKIADIEQLCGRHGISAPHLVLLAFAQALANSTNTSSPIFGFYQMARSAAFDGIENISGPCINMLPLGLKDVLTREILDSVSAIREALASRIPFEQSHIRTAMNAFDLDATELAFNAHVNLLWNVNAMGGSQGFGEGLFEPLNVGVPSDYSSPRPIGGKTTVDALDCSLIPDHNFFLDIGAGAEGVVLGARADAALMDVEAIKEFLGLIQERLTLCMAALR